jgi:hypothetical protein
MIIPHRGKGVSVILIGILAALLMNIISAKAFDYDYYREHIWPKLGTLWLAGFGCFLLGIYLRKYPTKENKAPEGPLSFDPKLSLLEKGSKYESSDHLLFIPIIYWGVIFFVLGIIYAGVSLWKGDGAW